MGTKLLDTTFLIHYWGGREATSRYLESNEDTHEFLTTALNLQELALGRELSGGCDPVRIRSVFDWVEVVPFDLEHSFEAAAIEAELRERGVHEDKLNELKADVLIGAVARARNATVVTKNTDDFRRLPGVDCEGH